jgi:hypothetical protein
MIGGVGDLAKKICEAPILFPFSDGIGSFFAGAYGTYKSAKETSFVSGRRFSSLSLNLLPCERSSA